MKKINEEIEDIKKRIFTRRNLKKAFTERELKELMINDNFYKPETLWFTKEMIESDIPRIIKVIKEHSSKSSNKKETKKV
ncbi:hypothetical protein LCGC14_0465600 [marine sediment metagenome]|uniref:Uncharacterized protein n=1 Tax=marine sediment metagenome TaxID=412755 RepID=A0A0F9V0H1_9ZZZZ